MSAVTEFRTTTGLLVPAITTEQMREVDRVAINEVGPNLYQMMENAAGLSGLRVTASAADGIVVDGELVDGDAVVTGMDSVSPSRLRFSDTVTGTVIASEEGEYALRVWDADSEGIRDFGAIEVFPYDPTWVVEANFTPRVGMEEVSIAHLEERGKTREKTVPGEVSFTRHGEEHRLVAFEDGPSILIVFADTATASSDARRVV
ncbi:MULTISPECIES: DUF1684 domain-containing protein [unclassified Cryobacterium]|uniref:DUF1684 domain-containing protein n=1 Tax=Cryobacterium sp. Y62 TaxID=2048284 RepID=UPI0011B0AF88|nr:MULTISPECIES: DUF1684 domain-containing protein [unclassified Cryobacterium]